MKAIRKHLTPTLIGYLVTAACLLGQASASAQSQTDDKPRWYQIELIIFAQQGNYHEQWPTDIVLAYPLNWKLLKSPDIADTPDATTEQQSLATAESLSTNLLPADQSSLPAQTPAPVIDLTRMPFYQLPETDFWLANEDYALQRDNRYRVLFHQSWRQPLTDNAQAPALLIKGGDTYGSHHELEGSITLSVSRYLHLQTNLWFTSFSRNYGQSMSEWPPLPLSPEQRVFFKEDQTPPLPLGDNWSNFSVPDEALDKILEQSYQVNQIVLMKQKRRMRSGETHYVDHPKLGIIIRLEPYELPDPDIDSGALPQEMDNPGQP